MKKTSKIVALVIAIICLFCFLSFGETRGTNFTDYGALSLIPPAITIILAFITRNTLISMFVGVWAGASIIMDWNLLDGLLSTFSDYIIPQMADSWNAGMLVLISLIGGFMYMINACGGAEAFGRWAQKHANSRRKAQLMTWVAPFLVLFDQGCLLVGIIMRPVTDRMKVSRVKLAYITDSMGAPLVSMSPINDNGVYLIGLIAAEISALGLSQSAYKLYFGMFQFNLYAVCTIFTVLIVILFGLDIGPMYEAEKRAKETGMTYGENDNLIAEPPENSIPENHNLSMINFLAPVLALIITMLTTIFYTGNVLENGVLGSFSNCDIQISIIFSFLIGSVVAGIVGIKSNLINTEDIFEQWTKGAATMVQVLIILIMAWSISSLTKNMEIGSYIAGLLQGNISSASLPFIMFILGIIISFATGSSWGVWAIGLPIAIPLAINMGISLPLIIGAVVSGGLFGDNCSPISDTTIQSSTSACCDHIQHVKTQLPYAAIVGGASAIGYLVAGYASEALALPITMLIIIGILVLLKKKSVVRNN
ncbi:Na+/H+ antiporter NhaC family protein [Clostridium grantii]|uniref:Na+/H+ antiporter NhaC n=1 Tax=Clostridium grantii DSM 8605 TaxID=1121316 RepID=A0A1M5TQ46_9CLOT|nr:Na+/H+ antiporter NhaC family protein [Clostridium grantii]SHH52882.1 Na+/H+ antiporter NhaC [Clostridium grantii DSM 8605]